MSRWRSMKGEARTVAIELFDDYHHMRCRLTHDGCRVTGIGGGEVLRFPFSTCIGAGAALQELVGVELDAGAALYRDGRPQRDCTHLFDLAELAIDFAPARGTRKLEIEIADQRADDSAIARARIDGVLVYDWAIAGETILAPHARRSLFCGFVPWARARFAGVRLQAALQIQKGVLVARGRRYVVDRNGGGLTDEPERIGSCFSFTEPSFSAAQRLHGYARDLRDGFPRDMS